MTAELFGDVLLIDPGAEDTAVDSSGVRYFDVPLVAKATRAE